VLPHKRPLRATKIGFTQRRKESKAPVLAPLHFFAALRETSSLMKVVKAEFLKSAFKEDDWPRDSRPEIAFLGRSNVGKSSLINSLLRVHGLARTSSTPGRTQSLNFFDINDQIRFVDFPGFGYARVPKEIKSSWGEMATSFLAKRRQLVLSIHVVDSRHEPTKQDLQLHEWLEVSNKPRLVVATKSDKLSNNELRKNLGHIAGVLDVDSVMAYSAKSGRGREELWRVIKSTIEQSS
jgi:GTP-binding protein